MHSSSPSSSRPRKILASTHLLPFFHTLFPFSLPFLQLHRCLLQARPLFHVPFTPPLTVPSNINGAWAPSPSSAFSTSGGGEDPQNPDELLNPDGSYPNTTIDELQLPDHLSFFNVTTPPAIHSLSIKGGGDLYYPDECKSPGDSIDWGLVNGIGHSHYRQSCSALDFCPDSALGSGFGWKPCLYFARGFCKNGSSCRFVHGLTGGKMDGVVVEPCQEELIRSKSLNRLSSSPSEQFMSSADSFPYGSPVASSKCMNFLMQQQHHHHHQQLQQQNDGQRSAIAAAAALMLGDEPQNRFMRSRIERGDFLRNGMVNPGSRQIYLTFPADSTFREEDVSNYFSLYGPVQDVRIPYQQKRMFGFVTFVYPETVKLILAKGNPHFVCDARVLVKPYKEKGKVPDKKPQQYQQMQERGGGDFLGCSTPTSLDSREHPYDLQPGGRPLFNGAIGEEAAWRRKLEEQSDLQQAIEIQGRRLINLQLELNHQHQHHHHHGHPYHNLRSPCTPPPAGFPCPSPGHLRVSNHFDSSIDISGNPPEKNTSPGATAGIVNPTTATSAEDHHHHHHHHHHHQNKPQQQMVEHGGGGFEDEPDKVKSAFAGGIPPKDDFGFQESPNSSGSIGVHNLPESPFASPIKSYFATTTLAGVERAASPGAASLDSLTTTTTTASTTIGVMTSSTLDMPSFISCFFKMPSHHVKRVSGVGQASYIDHSPTL
ncbi:Zinc finger CCCH domain-containing protein 53 [Acorus calamus]|uniref:Zinc finger CCCH domain-containing protein 53 n=1 Tax=Acorus calamus TaxID=4465 RepID=A0AAV9CZW5_ACOCL|nr:Zinc finger CCCH domain-containing protein 53 [Acorus calamus]